MSKLIIMKGLPASGKSTRAKEILQASGNTVRLNRDLLRMMLHFDKWTGRNEGMTKDAQRALADCFLLKGINVIIDDTNLNEGTLQSWRDLAKIHGATIEYVPLYTTMKECIERDLKRMNGVGRDVIVGMAMQNGLYPKPVKGIVICDLDGTLCNIDHRLQYMKTDPKDWKSFFAEIPNDTVKIDVQDMVLEYESEGYDIFFVSGRPDDHREATEIWLEKAFSGYRIHKALFMRRAGDRRPDTEVKKEIYDKYFKSYGVHLVIDDRPSVIRMWKEQGLNVVEIGSGVEF